MGILEAGKKILGINVNSDKNQPVNGDNFYNAQTTNNSYQYQEAILNQQNMQNPGILPQQYDEQYSQQYMQNQAINPNFNQNPQMNQMLYHPNQHNQPNQQPFMQHYNQQYMQNQPQMHDSFLYQQQLMNQKKYYENQNKKDRSFYTPNRLRDYDPKPQYLSEPVQPQRRKRVAQSQYMGNRYQQDYINFNEPQPIDYGYYQTDNYFDDQDIQYYKNNRYSNNVYDHHNYNFEDSYEIYEDNKLYNNNENYNNGFVEKQQHIYREKPLESFAQGFHKKNDSNILPTQIAREVKSEKLRVLILMLIGIVGIIICSIFIAAFYSIKNNNFERFAGFSLNNIPHPLVSIFLLIISVMCFFIGATDYSLLYSNVKKYEKDLAMGHETVPYFITRNYKNIISRGVYITWLSFATYILGGISLGILYGIQGLYLNNHTDVSFLFWKIATIGDCSGDITINIIVLIFVLAVHIINIIWSRSRKNNVISYYGQPIISSEEEKMIKKRANKICIIITCIISAVVLFAIVVPWIIIRRRRGKSINIFSKN